MADTLADAQTAAALIPAETTKVTAAKTALATKVTALLAALPAPGSNQPLTNAQMRQLQDLLPEIVSHNAVLAAAVTAVLVQTDAIAAMS